MANIIARNVLKFRSILFTWEIYFFLTSLVSSVSLFTLYSPMCIFKGSLVVASAVAIQSCKRSSILSLHEKKDQVYSRKLSYPVSSISFPNSFSPELHTNR